jgi:hypothetical protein
VPYYQAFCFNHARPVAVEGLGVGCQLRCASRT